MSRTQPAAVAEPCAAEPCPAAAESCPAVAEPRPDGPAPAPGSSGFRSDRAADRVMRRALRIPDIDLRSGGAAHQAFRISVIISALRCVITYVLIPVLVPILSLAGWVAAPVGIVLCAIAAVNGVISVRRFWRADHPHRWTYTAFIGVVFTILTISVITELSRWGVLP